MNTIPFLCALAIGGGTFLVAQNAALPAPGVLPPVPIHTKPDQPAYGTWAMGKDYKASFHDGFTFHPMLGTTYAEGLPWRWTTVAVTSGDRVVEIGVAVAAQAQPSPWRYEYRTGALRECYDVRAAGVEQSFVLESAPPHAGDLTIRGRISSRLAAAPRAPAHAPVTFADASGRAILTYGSAIAFDASGRRTEVDTAVAGDVLSLIVPGSWLAGARYPVTVDPMISTAVRQLPGQIQRIEVAQDGTSTNSLIYFVEYGASGSDRDVVAYLATGDFTTATTVFTDLDGVDATGPSAAYVGGAQRWVLTYQRNGWTYAYRLVRNDLTLNGSGAPKYITNAPGVVGGSRDGQTAAIVLAPTAPVAPHVLVAIYNPTTDLVEVSMLAHAASTNGDIERVRPAVNQVAKNNAWLVVWEEIDRVNLTTSIRGNLVRRDGTTGSARDFTVRPAGAPAHRMRPAVAGMDGRYLVACLAGATADRDYAQQLHTRRVDWADMMNAGTPGIGRVLASAGVASLGRIDLAYDDETRSHWGVVYQSLGLLGSAVLVARLGHTGGAVESQALATLPASTQQWTPAVTFDRAANAFGVGFAADTGGHAGWYQRLGYGAAGTEEYGVGCGGSISAMPAPVAGHEFFRVLLGGAASATSAALMIQGRAGPFALDAFGAPGCRLHLRPDGLVTIPAALVGGGSIVDLPLPDAPAFVGDFACQWLMVTPTANPLGLTTTRGLTVRVR